MADTTSRLAETPAPARPAAKGLPIWAKVLIYVAVLIALGFAAQAWLA